MGPMWIALALPAAAGTWQGTEVVQPLFAVSSPPEAPAVAVNALGHAVAAWDDTGSIKYAERSAGGSWTLGAKVRKGATGGPVQVGIGSDETTAVVWVTVGTEFVPAYLVASVRAPGGTFPPPLTLAPGAGLWWFDVGVAGDGTTYVTWGDAAGVEVSALTPSGTVWSTPVLVSDPLAVGSFPDLAVDDLGDVVVVWSQGSPASIGSAYLLAGSATWDPPVVVSSGLVDAWGARAGIDAAGDAAVGFVESYAMQVATRPAGGPWDLPATLSDPATLVYEPAFAMDDQGDLLAAWQVLDSSNNGEIWAASLTAGGAWSAPTRLSRSGDSADWPTAAFSNDGTVAAVSWVDDLTVTARVSIGIPGSAGFGWTRSAIGSGSWGSIVPVAAGGGTVAASWATQLKSNPNAAKILGRAWE